MDNILDVHNLHWSAGDIPILSDISFNIPKGAFVGLIGPNGAGKSSLMRCLYGVNKPQVGEIFLHNKNLLDMPARDQAKQVAVILQEHTTHMGLNVWDVVAQGLTPHKGLFEWTNKQDLKNIELAIEKMDLQSLKNQPFEQLSGGEKQRVMLARAQVQNPQLLIMDEPTNHLDVHYQIEVLNTVKKMDISVLASIHDLNLAAAFCDYLLVIDKGKIVDQGLPKDVLTENMISKVFKTCVSVDKHPLSSSDQVRITYSYSDLDALIAKNHNDNEKGDSNA
ncbi:MAG: iron complex transport system ATP-binding protein [Psychrobacter glaciei]|jgi:iron complex transport system ATP-binding protein